MEHLDKTQPYPAIARYLIKEMLDKYRDELSDKEFDLLLGLHECHGNFENLSKETGRDIHEIHQEYETFRERVVARTRKDGQRWRTRISTPKLRKILEAYDFTENERKILDARIQSRNQMIAAIALGLTYTDYVNAFQAIRDRYGF